MGNVLFQEGVIIDRIAEKVSYVY